MSNLEEGKRYNKGKLRYDLVPVRAQEEYVKVLTSGAQKYSDNNWRMGTKMEYRYCQSRKTSCCI